MEKKNSLVYNIIFLIVCAGILLFLWNAPEESTVKLPVDDAHNRFHTMKKKEAEQFCRECHSPDGEAPLPENHPPKYRCLFCHKKQKTGGS
ncbi:MAG TPA: hypothetical protein EYP57_02805 [Thermodesulfobacteriaceae bacterium]|nr:hypothetical protein [Thermodesulfobacteriaceae bacterium]